MFDENRIEGGRNFMNKLWNAARFILMNNDLEIKGDKIPDKDQLEIADLWILEELQLTVNSVRANMDKYRFNDAARDIYEFTWNSFCDWYIELAKIRFYSGNENDKRSALQIAVYVLRNILQLLHPFAPFITEELWQSLKSDDEDDLIVSPYPLTKTDNIDTQSVKEMKLLMDVITAARTIRSEMTVPPSKKATLLISGVSDDQAKILNTGRHYIENLVKLESLEIAEHFDKPELSGSAVLTNMQLYMPLAGLIDMDKEKERIEKDIAAYQGRLKAVMGKLNNERFVANAPEAIIAKEREKEKSYTETLELLKENLRQYE